MPVKSKQLPLVSICIPTYNGERYLPEAIESATNQTYKNIEIIISDDDSMDATLEIAKSYSELSTIPFKIVHHNPNGIGSNWNNCIKVANGEYIKFVFQDDVLFPECVEKMIEIALEDKKIGLVFSKRTFIDQNNNDHFSAWKEKFKDLHIYWTGLQRINSGKKLLKECNCLLDSPLNKVGEPSVVLIKKSVFNSTGYFNEELVQILDYEFWYRIFKHYKIGFVDEELVHFRLHNEQTTQKNNRTEINDYEKYYKLLYKNLFFQLSPKIQKMLLVKYSLVFRYLLTLKWHITTNRKLGEKL